MCFDLMGQLELALPSEAQWEFGARGGTSSVYSSGDEPASLAGVANLSDAYGRTHGAQSGAGWEKDHDDGNTVHARVGSFRANGFGLHDVHGNVWEGCLDGYGSEFYARTMTHDPVSPWRDAATHVNRGGSFDRTASYARSANRNRGAPEFRDNFLGLRPSRALRSSMSPLHPPK